MCPSIGIDHFYNEQKEQKSVKIKETPEDFIVQEVIDKQMCTILPVVDLENFKAAEELFKTVDGVNLCKEERKKIYDIARYHPFKRLKTIEQRLVVEDNSLDIFVFTLLKYNYSDHSVRNLLARRLCISEAAIQFGGTKDKRAITLQEISVKCTFETLFSYAISLARKEKMHLHELGYEEIHETINSDIERLFKENMNIEYIDTEEEIGIYNIRRGSSKKLGDLDGNYFRIRIRDTKLEFNKSPGKFYNYFGPQRFGNLMKNHIIGEYILNKDYSSALAAILDSFDGDNESYMKKALLNKISSNSTPKYIITGLQRHQLMLYLHAYQSMLFNMEVNSRIEKGAVEIGKDKIEAGGEMADACEKESFDNIFIPLRKLNHKMLKGGYRKMVENICDFKYKIDENGVLFEFFLMKSCYATVALREILGNAEIESN